MDLADIGLIILKHIKLSKTIIDMSDMINHNRFKVFSYILYFSI